VGFAILSGEDGDGLVWQYRILKRETNAGAHLSGGAAADGIHH
jgi:hypothetical protein